MRIPEQPKQSFQSQTKQAFAPGGFVLLPGSTEVASPRVTVQKRQGNDGEELFKFGRVGHVRCLKIEAALFEMAEQLLDAPPQAIERESLPTAEAVADNMKMIVAPTLGRDLLVGEKHVHAPHRHSFRGGTLPRPAGGPVKSGGPPADPRVSLDANDVGDFLVVEPAQPPTTSEFPVHGQNPNLLGIHQAQNLSQNVDALRGVGVAPLGGLRKDLPGNGDGDSIDDHPDGQDVDVSFAIFPIGPVHRQDPAPCGLVKLAQDESPDGGQRQGASEEEVLEPSVAAFIPRSGEVFGGQNGEVDRPVTQEACNHQGQALHPSEVEAEGGIEFFDKMFFEHPNFGRHSAVQAFSSSFSLIFNELCRGFLSCSVTVSD